MPDTRQHMSEVALATSPERVFALLHTPSAIRAWWSADRVVVVPKVGGIWIAAWGADEDDPDYISGGRIKVFDPPRRLELDDSGNYAKGGGPPFDARMTTAFDVRPSEDGCILRVVQDGFPADQISDDYVAACEAGWRSTLASIKQYVEADAS